jgi:DNA-binding XRE family transcriptional regulator
VKWIFPLTNLPPPAYLLRMDLKTAREALGWSQADMDRKAKVARGTVQDIESGKNANPTLKVAFKLFGTLRAAGLEGLTIEEVFPSDQLEDRPIDRKAATSSRTAG